MIPFPARPGFAPSTRANKHDRLATRDYAWRNLTWVTPFLWVLLALFQLNCTQRDSSNGLPLPASGTPLDTRSLERASTKPIELFTWWARVGHSDGLAALQAEHRLRHPEDSIISATTNLSGNARKTLRDRMMRNDPPDLFQANIGRDLMQWAILDGFDARASKLVALDDVIPKDTAEWRRVMPSSLIDAGSFQGKLYAAPLRVARVNSLFINKRIFDEHNLSPPRTIQDLFTVGEKLKETGIVPLALGSRDPWTLELLIFECLLISQEGPQFYEDYFRGRLNADDPRMMRTLDLALQLLNLTNPDHALLDWNQATTLVTDGKAAMTAMGDWAIAVFSDRKLARGKDYVEQIFPGKQETFVYTADTFGLAKGGPNPAGGARFLQTTGSAKAQLAISLAWGNLPARLDVKFPANSAQIEKQNEFRRGPLALALSGLLPTQFADDVGQALAAMAKDRDTDPVRLALKSRYVLLR